MQIQAFFNFNFYDLLFVFISSVPLFVVCTSYFCSFGTFFSSFFFLLIAAAVVAVVAISLFLAAVC